MTALPPVPNVVRATVSGTSSELNWANVMHWRYTGSPPNSASVNDFAAALLGGYNGNMAPIMADDTTITGCVVTDLSSDTSNVGTAEGATAGTLGSEILPANSAALVTYPITVRYRGGHPRQYLFVGTANELQDQSTWTTDFVNDVTDAWAAVQATVTDVSFDGTAYTNQCAVSYRTAKAPRPAPGYLVLNFSSAFNVEVRLASQRRRMRRRT